MCRYITGKKACLGSGCVAIGAKFELSYGHYADQLSSVLDLFDKKQIKVLFQEDMIRWVGVLDAIRLFLV